MLKQVYIDLGAFGAFFGFLLFMFALILAILDLSNYEYSDDPDMATIQLTPAGPDKEYMYIPKILARYFAVLRISLGDFELSGVKYLSEF